MTYFIETGNTGPARYESRCARCHKIIHIGEMQRGGQIHSGLNYRWGSAHVPNCQPLIIKPSVSP